jgi:ribosomal protein S12 methylthiotransferase
VAIVGTGDYQKIVEIVERVETGESVKEVSADPTFIADENLPRYRTTTEGVAYLRAAEGLDYRCAFCIIPQLLPVIKQIKIDRVDCGRSVDNWPAKGSKN